MPALVLAALLTVVGGWAQGFYPIDFQRNAGFLTEKSFPRQAAFRYEQLDLVLEKMRMSNTTGVSTFKPSNHSNHFQTTSAYRHPSRLPWTVECLPFFCKIEHKWALKNVVPVKFRLGSVEYVDGLEGKAGL